MKIYIIITLIVLGMDHRASAEERQLTNEQIKILKEGRISTTLPKVLSGTIGFGIGHAVAGKYSDGWKFTVMDTLLVAGIVTLGTLGVNEGQKDERRRRTDPNYEYNGNTFVIFYGIVFCVAGLAGTRVWQSINLSRRIRYHNMEYDRLTQNRASSFGIEPLIGQNNIGAQLRIDFF